jgi:hypothetical protein
MLPTATRAVGGYFIYWLKLKSFREENRKQRDDLSLVVAHLSNRLNASLKRKKHKQQIEPK